MRRLVFTLTLALPAGGLVACSRTDAPPTEPANAEQAVASTEPAPAEAGRAAFEARAKAATGALKKGLMAALKGAMKDGPAAAVTACNTRAPSIADAAAIAEVRVGRTATKLRNPANAPAPWLEPLLAEYAAKPAADAQPRVVELGDGRFGYVEPLYVGGLCLTCHGQPAQIPDAVKGRLATLYPRDAATGYDVGAFRGLVWASGR